MINNFPDDHTGEQLAAYIQASLEELEGAAYEVCKKTQAPFALAYMSMLGSMSLISQHFVDVQTPHGHVTPVSLFLISIAKSGERKSTCDRMFTKVLDQWISEQAEIYDRAYAAHKAELKIWNAKGEALQKMLSKTVNANDSDEEKNVSIRIRDHEAAKPLAPVRMQLKYQNTTLPAVLKSLNEQLPTGGLMDDEGGHVLDASVTDALAVFNKLWDGNRVTVTRVDHNKSFTLNGKRFSIALMIQPQIFDDFIKSKQGRAVKENGFLQRCLVSTVTSTQGTRRHDPHGDFDLMPKLEKFTARLQVLLDQIASEDKKEPRLREVIVLSPDAGELFWKFQNEIESQLRPGGKYESISGVASRIAENTVRIAAIYHFWINSPFPKKIHYLIMERAILRARSFLEQQLYLFGKPTSIEEQEREDVELHKWLVSHCCNQTHIASVTKTVIMQYGPNKFRKSAKLELVLDRLMLRRWVWIGFSNNRVKFITPCIEQNHVPLSYLNSPQAVATHGVTCSQPLNGHR